MAESGPDIKLTVDAEDALKALKAIKNEAREAAKALKELESMSDKVVINEGGMYASGKGISLNGKMIQDTMNARNTDREDGYPVLHDGEPPEKVHRFDFRHDVRYLCVVTENGKQVIDLGVPDGAKKSVRVKAKRCNCVLTDSAEFE